MQMPFGKHRGSDLRDLPDSYLEWLLGLDNLRSFLRRALEAEAYRRECDRDRGRDQEERRSFAQRLNAPRPEVVDELVGAGLRSLARKYHPDAGARDGGRRMSDLNGAADWLKAAIRAIA
jgi:hypothetical protein